jgi:uncharacterized membrane protein YagU involved in acid resistance
VPSEVSWAIFFIVGTLILGIVYALIRRSLPRGPISSGLVFGALVWCVDVVVFQPLIGTGLLVRGVPAGLSEGITALVLSLIYGVVLGLVYANLRSSAARRDVVPG